MASLTREIPCTGGNKYRSAPEQTQGVAVAHFAGLASAVEQVESELVYIGTPPVTHAGLTQLALGARRHVLLEKPLAANADDADTIVAAAAVARENHGVVCGVNIGMRYNAAVREMRHQLKLGRIGEVIRGHLRMHYGQWPREWQVQPWCAGREQGGPLREVGTHFLFGLLEVFGHDSVRRVRADVVYPDGVDGVAAESAVDGELELSVPGRAAPLVISVTVRTDGTEIHPNGKDLYELELVGNADTSLMLFDFTSLRVLKGGVPVDSPLVRSADYGRKACVEALFREAAGEGDEDVGNRLVSSSEARRAQRIIDAFLSSGGEWVDLGCD